MCILLLLLLADAVFKKKDANMVNIQEIYSRIVISLLLCFNVNKMILCKSRHWREDTTVVCSVDLWWH